METTTSISTASLPSASIPPASIPPAALARNQALLRHYMRPLAGSLVVALVMALVLGVVSALVAALVGPCVQVITAPADSFLQYRDLFGAWLGPVIAHFMAAPGITAGELLGRVPLLLVGLALLKSLCGIAQWFIWERGGEVVALHLRNDLAAAYLHLSPSVRRTESGRAVEEQLSSGVTADVKLVREYLVHFYGGLPREAFQVVFLTIMLVLLSPKLTAIFLLGVAPAIAIAGRIGRQLRRRAARALADYSQLTEWLQQRLIGIETIKHYGTEPIEIRKMEVLTASLYQRFLKAARVKARTSPMLEMIAVIAMVVVLGIALRDIQLNQSSGAVDLSFFSTLGLLSQAGAKLGRYLNANREGAAAVDRLRQQLAFFTANKQDQVVVHAVPAATTQIVADRITVTYPGATRPALRDFSFAFQAGKIYCLAGPSGAGKSTLFSTLLGLVTPDAGSLCYEATEPPVGSAVAYMPQKVILRPDTIAGNVAYPESPDLERVTEALAQVGLDSLVVGLPQGAMTQVGAGGSGMSGGQAQRILLARLWYLKRPFVLIDEGTSALDPEVERTVYRLIRQLADRGAVVVTIAHRQAAAEHADELLLLDQGVLKIAGSPSTVMASPAYQALLG
ncbi:MAG: ABC transporter ATP-binding protein [Deltaproteobacteria bacterium]|nr:ABC transporter ATP-binding protein [Deltaproteobacteria bacterium]